MIQFDQALSKILSAMDGFALKASDIQGASKDNPVFLEIIGSLKAGDAAGETARFWDD